MIYRSITTFTSMYKKILLILFSIVFLVACNNNKNKEKNENPLVLDNGICDRCENFISSVEMAGLIQELGVPFSSEYLLTSNHISRFTSEFDRTFVIGLLVSDLGYLNIYDQLTDIENLIPMLKRLADDVHVGHLIDYTTIKRLAGSKTDPDSLMYLSIVSFSNIDKYWREHKRSDLSTLLISGVWLEELYLATQVIKQTENERLKERIGEQKTILKDLLEMMGRYKSNKNFASLITEFEKIKKAYEGVVISYQFGEAVQKTGNSKAEIEENTLSTVQITKKQLTAIIKATEEVRNKWVVEALADHP